MERSPKHVRATLGGAYVVDSAEVRLVWVDRPYPAYWFPDADVRADLLPAGAVRTSPGLPGLVGVDWGAVDQWYEEDEPVYVHARDPCTRVDVLASSRHVVVELDGVRLAESGQPRVLFETGLPPRFYLPARDARLDLLRPSATTTMCPYKGTATYLDAVVNGVTHRDLVWCYPAPFAESQKIAGLLCFYPDRARLVVDGIDQST
ncbi:uncharacterized protein (DUF427 family) [Actinokineospora auranticolor]|uniref:Uncharacterized protein (DUF427 family) n=1 Tax=Actinokineospora auranticolor TaxID=155976 RepID=A0A2S6H0K2_9PSEU|nr:uncharacterized protein (DUF427 family) [Actinokineospora auranticolor]